ncbi:hypothetical protein DRW71_15165 [Salmonella enterica subsp. diarizonae]|uniref:Uncharacterized protein n=2 Tax=Salmonella enterica TaxID=28901 RepID=A0A7Z1T584_SALET|nr:hypothetical protein DOE63_28685 [Salmonella enterica subsp. diarizonae serovar 59:z10:-]EAA7554627.1 hypothetical protein [Salmonella enterica]EAA7931538.1 hypothetical protein [Salmonella enterica subsp. enterica serovar Redlands]EAB9741411.1 hypothetical protein [Salmonella enterica subsp. diarizonae]EAW1164662.1 hypothetical protein [Salmonella enterica subsp. enterica]EBE3721919.1 hypothetical protein [Salmonella enterica subsp. diarizonae serovar 42:l,v:1,5,7]EBH8950443.1 hypothetica
MPDGAALIRLTADSTPRPDKALAPSSGNLRQRNFHFIFPFSSSNAFFLNGRGLIPASFLLLCCDIDNKFYLDHLKTVNLHPKT